MNLDMVVRILEISWLNLDFRMRILDIHKSRAKTFLSEMSQKVHLRKKILLDKLKLIVSKKGEVKFA